MVFRSLIFQLNFGWLQLSFQWLQGQDFATSTNIFLFLCFLIIVFIFLVILPKELVPTQLVPLYFCINYFFYTLLTFDK